MSIKKLFAPGSTLQQMFDLDGMQQRQQMQSEAPSSIELDTFRSSNTSPTPPHFPSPSPSPSPLLYLVIYNISKSNNIKDLIQTAMSFSAMQILVVGAPKLDSALLTDIPHKRFQNLPECATYITLTLKADLVGVEIMEDKTKCFNIDTLPFTRDTAFMLGNEGSGMNEKQLAICDYFVYISQFGHGTASLNVNVAAGVVLQRFDDWRRR